MLLLKPGLLMLKRVPSVINITALSSGQKYVIGASLRVRHVFNHHIA